MRFIYLLHNNATDTASKEANKYPVLQLPWKLAMSSLYDKILILEVHLAQRPNIIINSNCNKVCSNGSIVLSGL